MQVVRGGGSSPKVLCEEYILDPISHTLWVYAKGDAIGMHYDSTSIR